jgi:hypothetical protein
LPALKYAFTTVSLEQPITIPQLQDFGGRSTVEASRSTIARKASGEKRETLAKRLLYSSTDE